MINMEDIALDSMQDDTNSDSSSKSLEESRKTARKATNLLKALAHEPRLMLLCLLVKKERSVTELETILSMRQPAVSQQLARLRADGIVAPRRDGKTIYYRLSNDDVIEIMTALQHILCGPQK